VVLIYNGIVNSLEEGNFEFAGKCMEMEHHLK
jgi:hypothetical protein